jgi:glucose-6-phosphate dehydrogenase assembly protein OpcA
METRTHESKPAKVSSGIDVGKLEKELAAIWQANNEDATNANADTTRVCVLNLVVYAEHQEDRADVDSLLDEVSLQTPTRTIVVVANRESTTANLEAYVSARSRVASRGAKQVCGEQITIEVSGSLIDTVSTAIEPLLISDLPVFLWWKDIPHYEDPLFTRLVAIADRIVIDSQAFDHPHEDLLHLAKIVEGRRELRFLSDLNWGRLTSWRTLLASFYDVPEYCPILERVDSVIVEYDAPDVKHDSIATQALLICGWLVSRLGWEPTSGWSNLAGQTRQFSLRASGGRSLELEFRSIPDRADHDGLLGSVSLRAQELGAEFKVKLNEVGTKLQTEANITGLRHLDRVLAYEQKSEGQRLARELGILTSDPIYEEALIASARLISPLVQA